MIAAAKPTPPACGCLSSFCLGARRLDCWSGESETRNGDFQLLPMNSKVLWLLLFFIWLLSSESHHQCPLPQARPTGASTVVAAQQSILIQREKQPGNRKTKLQS